MDIEKVRNMTFAEMVANRVISVVIEPSVNFPDEFSFDEFGEHNLMLPCAKHFPSDIREVENDPMMVINDLHRISKEKRCLDSGKPEKEKGYVYVMKNNRNGLFKIGFTKRKPAYREATLQSQEPEVSLLFSSSKNLETKDERSLHENYKSSRVRGEWFGLSDNDVSDIKKTLGVK